MFVKKIRIILLSILLVFLVSFLITQVKLPLPKNDFIGYWSVGYLAANGQNPYGAQAVFNRELEWLAGQRGALVDVHSTLDAAFVDVVWRF